MPPVQWFNSSAKAIPNPFNIPANIALASMSSVIVNKSYQFWGIYFKNNEVNNTLIKVNIENLFPILKKANINKGVLITRYIIEWINFIVSVSSAFITPIFTKARVITWLTPLTPPAIRL